MATNRQNHYEFDLSPDGSPDGGAGRSGEDTAVIDVVDLTPFALRIAFQRDGGGGGSLKLNGVLEYSTDQAAWTEVPEDGSRVAELFELVDNGNYAHDDDILSQELSGVTNWINGAAGDGDGGSNEVKQIQIGVNDCSEIQFNVQSNGAAAGVQYYFRVTDAGSALANYDIYPDLTMVAGAETDGNLAVTLGTLTLAGTGKPGDLTGDLAETLGLLTLAATGKPGDLVGALVETLGLLTLSATGGEPQTDGNLNVTLGIATLAATGKPGDLTGDLAETLGLVTLSATGGQPTTDGNLDATLGTLLLSATGTVTGDVVSAFIRNRSLYNHIHWRR